MIIQLTYLITQDKIIVYSIEYLLVNINVYYVGAPFYIHGSHM